MGRRYLSCILCDLAAAWRNDHRFDPRINSSYCRFTQQVTELLLLRPLKSPRMIMSKNVFYVEELFTDTLNPNFVHQMDSTGSNSKHKAPPASLQPVLYWCPSSAHCYFQITVDRWTPVFSLSPSGCWLCIRADLMQLTDIWNSLVSMCNDSHLHQGFLKHLCFNY